MKTLYEKMRDNRFKALQREATRRYHEDAKRQEEKAKRERLVMAQMALGTGLDLSDYAEYMPKN